MNVKTFTLLSVYTWVGALTTVPWGKKQHFYLHSKGDRPALLLNQKDINPGTGLQLYLCEVLLMDQRDLGNTRRRKECESLSFLNTQGHEEVGFFFLCFVLFFSKHSIALNPEQALYCIFLQ